MTKPIRFTKAAPRQLVARILEQPEVVSMVRALEPRALARLIDHVGLEDSGELVALATTEQLGRVFDEDLWRSARPGEDESFDPDRFGLWLEVMLEAGEDFVAEKLAGLPEELVLLGLGRHVLVIDLDELAIEMSDAGAHGDRIEKALDASLCVEFDQYRVIARVHDGWDAIVGVLHALDARAPELFRSLLERLCRTSSDFIEASGGLYDVLTLEQMLESDAAAEREDRRAREGFIAPSAAASFLRLARTTPLEEIVARRAADPVTYAYFRDLEPQATQAKLRAEPAHATELLRLLDEAHELEAPRPALPAPATKNGEPLFQQALALLRMSDPEAYDRRMQELAYLANVLVAGCTYGDRRFRPLEAAEAAVAVCNLGLEHLAPTQQSAAALLAHERADKLFRIGWKLLDPLLLEAVEKITGLLERRAQSVRSSRLARTTADARAVAASAKPWRVRRFLAELTDVLDDTTRDRLDALLRELPLLAGEPGAERSFFATIEQLEAARSFLRQLHEPAPSLATSP